MTRSPSSPESELLAKVLSCRSSMAWGFGQKMTPVEVDAIAAALQPATPTACPYKGPFGCKCEPGECKYTHGGGEAARAPAPAALSDQIEDIICGGNCMHPEVCDGTETTWCGQRTEELLGLIAPAQRPLQPAETQKIAADAIRTFCRSLGAAAVQNSHGVERIYHAGISLDALAAAVALALSSTEGNTP